MGRHQARVPIAQLRDKIGVKQDIAVVLPVGQVVDDHDHLCVRTHLRLPAGIQRVMVDDEQVQEVGVGVTARALDRLVGVGHPVSPQPASMSERLVARRRVADSFRIIFVGLEGGDWEPVTPDAGNHVACQVAAYKADIQPEAAQVLGQCLASNDVAAPNVVRRVHAKANAHDGRNMASGDCLRKTVFNKVQPPTFVTLKNVMPYGE